jgi:hypothetical protein
VTALVTALVTAAAVVDALVLSSFSEAAAPAAVHAGKAVDVKIKDPPPDIVTVLSKLEVKPSDFRGRIVDFGP